MTAKAATIPATGQNQNRTAPQTFYARYFFVAMAGLFPIIAVIGFTPNVQDIIGGVSKPHWLVHVHGALMSGWLLVFLAQAVLAARGNFRFHRQLGLLAAGLGVIVWITMGAVAMHILIANHPPEGSWLFDLMLGALYLMACFGLFFAWGILVRKKDPAAHKRLLLLATLVTMQTAVDRIHGLPAFGIESPYANFMYLDALLLPLFVYDFTTLRCIHRITWFGLAFIVAAQLSVAALLGTRAWHKFLFILTAPLMEQIVEIKLSDAQTDLLLGDYQSEPANEMTVSRDAGKLYLRYTGQGKQEIFATSATEFFLRTEIGQYVFVKDANGMVSKVVVHEGARTSEMQRVKLPRMIIP